MALISQIRPYLFLYFLSPSLSQRFNFKSQILDQIAHLSYHVPMAKHLIICGFWAGGNKSTHLCLGQEECSADRGLCVLSFPWQASHPWTFRGGYCISRGKGKKRKPPTNQNTKKQPSNYKKKGLRMVWCICNEPEHRLEQNLEKAKGSGYTQRGSGGEAKWDRHTKQPLLTKFTARAAILGPARSQLAVHPSWIWSTRRQ